MRLERMREEEIAGTSENINEANRIESLIA
jgi:hypothetical protein